MTEAPMEKITGAAPEKLAPPRSQARDIWDQFKTHKGAMTGLVVLGVMILAIIIGPFLWTQDPSYVNPDAAKMILGRNKPPSWQHPLGTDQLARDMLARMLYGGRISLAVGAVAMLISVVIGTGIGVLAEASRLAAQRVWSPLCAG